MKEKNNSTPTPVLQSIEGEFEIIFDLFKRFMPKEIAVDDPKQLAMYEVFHRIKALAACKGDDLEKWVTDECIKYSNIPDEDETQYTRGVRYGKSVAFQSIFKKLKPATLPAKDKTNEAGERK